jgi:hypothetical protein
MRKFSLPVAAFVVLPCLGTAGVEYRMELRQEPEPGLSSAHSADEFLKIQRRNGADKQEAAAMRPEMVKGFEELRKGYTRTGVVRLTFAEWGSRVESFFPMMNGPSRTSLVVEVFADGVTLTDRGKGYHPTIRNGDVRQYHAMPVDQYILGNNLREGVRKVGSRLVSGCLVESYEFIRPRKARETFEVTYAGRSSDEIVCATSWLEHDGRRIKTTEFEIVGGWVDAGDRRAPKRAILRRYGKVGLLHTETYSFVRAIPDTRPPAGFGLAKGSVVMDSRMGSENSVSYAWTGSLSPLDQIKGMRRTPILSPSPEGSQKVLFGFGLFLMVVGILLRMRAQAPRKFVVRG